MTMSGDNRFVFVCPMYNASLTLPRMMFSLLGQSYENWRVILIDDCSEQDHRDVYNEFLAKVWLFLKTEERDGFDQLTLIDNDVKKWEVANVLKGISMCEDNDIVCRLDVDDWLTDLDALTIINTVYEQYRCEVLWTAHRWGFTDKNISGPLPDNVDPYMGYPWVSSHLKTFRRYLLRDVPYENFTNMNGELVRRAGDQAIFLPCLYRAKKRIFLPRVMYHYTIDEQNGKVYQTDDAQFQKAEADYIRKRGYVTSGISWEKHDMFIRDTRSKSLK